MNIIINCLFNHLEFNTNPVNNGYQWINPAIIANIAPIDNIIGVLKKTLHSSCACMKEAAKHTMVWAKIRTTQA